jgi:hypothetical protein
MKELEQRKNNHSMEIYSKYEEKKINMGIYIIEPTQNYWAAPGAERREDKIVTQLAQTVNRNESLTYSYL